MVPPAVPRRQGLLLLGDLEFVRLKKMKKKTVNRVPEFFTAVPLRLRRGERGEMFDN